MRNARAAVVLCMLWLRTADPRYSANKIITGQYTSQYASPKRAPGPIFSLCLGIESVNR